MSNETADWLMFALGEQRWALAAGSVRQIMRCPEITGVPGASLPCLGLAEWQGRLLTVLDVTGWLSHVPKAEAAQERLIVWQRDSHAAALRVDAVMGLRRLPASALLPLQCALPSPWHAVAGLLRDGGDILPILDPAVWFSPEEEGSADQMAAATVSP